MDTGRHDLAAVLRRAGVRVTAPRLSVLAALVGGPAHLSAEAIVAAVRAHVGDSSPQTVYNVLHTFTDAGLVRRIEPAGSAGLYELRVADNHHHVVCRRCGAVADIPCVVGAAPCLEPSQTSGFAIDEAEITFWGFCPHCRNDRSDGRDASQIDKRNLEPEQPRSRAMSRQKETPREEKDRRG